MLVSTKGRYALRVLLMLAENAGNGYLQLDVIAKSEDISEKYLESIARLLVRAHMIEGLRGRGGGYRLTRKANEYSVGEILRLTEGSLAPVACLDCATNQCRRAPQCKTLPMWQKLDAIICNYLDNVTLSDLQDGAKKSNDGGNRADVL